MKIIGIDTGVHTGVAVWDTEKKTFDFIGSMSIHRALHFVETSGAALVRVEDARQRKLIPKGSGRERLQNVGSVKRDAKVWEDFLKDKGIPFEMVAPKDNLTKLSSADFARLTGWCRATNEHGRDAAGLVFGMSARHAMRALQN
jgi:predicted RNase H-like nuclease (RuvC/YqgF family)